jgi:hypothetical protein
VRSLEPIPEPVEPTPSCRARQLELAAELIESVLGMVGPSRGSIERE